MTITEHRVVGIFETASSKKYELKGIQRIQIGHAPSLIKFSVTSQ